MSDWNSTDYYRSRERQERAIARKCLNPHIAAIHFEMADRYADLIAQVGVEPQGRPLRNAVLL